MAIDLENIEARKDQRHIPGWVKIAITLFACIAGAVFVLALLSRQETLFGLPTGRIALLAFAPALLSILAVVAFWFFPNHPLTISIYWLARFFRAEICVLALFGIVLLITFGIPFYSIRGGVSLLILLLFVFMSLFLPPVTLDHFPLPWMQKIFTFWEKLTNKINSIPTIALSIVVALLPIVIVCSYIYFGLDARLSDYGPYSHWNDETGYWVWVRSFSQVGLNAGYNSPDELIARAPFSHYGEGSPFYVYMYGAIARAIGWFPALPILINFVFLALAILLFIRFIKLEPVQIIFVGLITVLTWPILLYLPMTTHETLNQVIGFILAIIFFRFLTQREQISLPVRISFVFLVFLAALVRLSWGLLLVPIIFYSVNGSVLRRILLSVFLGGSLYVLAFLITNYLVPPINNSIMSNMRNSLTTGPQIFIDYISYQFSRMFHEMRLNPNIAVMFQIVIIFGWSLVRLVRMIRSKFSIHSILQSRAVLDMYNVASLAAAGLLFYIQAGFYRTFAPSLLIVYLLQAAKKDYRPLVILLVINLMFFQSYMTFYGSIGDIGTIRMDYTSEITDRVQLQSELEKWIKFDEATQNPWCNTLLIPLHFYDSRLTVIPPGIGISYIFNQKALQIPVKSKYLLLDPQTYEAFAGRLNASPLASFSIGDLYYNRESGCELNQ